MRLSSIRFGGQYERYRFPADRHAVAKFAHQRFGGVRERLEPGQSAAGSFDGVDEAENVAENLAVIGLSLEAYQLAERLVPPTTQVWRHSKLCIHERPSTDAGVSCQSVYFRLRNRRVGPGKGLVFRQCAVALTL